MTRFTSRMGFPFPDEGEDPYYDSFNSFANNVDVAEFAEADNNNLIPTGTAIFEWNLSGSVLSWDADTFVSGFTSNFSAKIVGPTGTPPVIALAGLAGNIDNGRHTYLVTFVDTFLVETLAGPAVSIMVIDKTVDGQATVTSIPIGPPGTIARKIYRTSAGGALPYKLLATIADNVTLILAGGDNTADVGLGAVLAPAITSQLSQITILEGQVVYINMPRLMQTANVVTPLLVAPRLLSDAGGNIFDKIIIAVRRNGIIYFRNGVALADGESGAIWERPTIPGSQGLTPAQKTAINAVLHSHFPVTIEPIAGTTQLDLPDPSPETIRHAQVYRNGSLLKEGDLPLTTPPVAALAGLAGNIDNGQHSYLFTFVDGLSAETLACSPVDKNIVDKTTNGQVNFTGIPIGPFGTVWRRIYRSLAGGGPVKLLTTIADNVTTIYTDNTADGGLGVNPPPNIVVGDYTKDYTPPTPKVYLNRASIFNDRFTVIQEITKTVV